MLSNLTFYLNVADVDHGDGVQLGAVFFSFLNCPAQQGYEGRHWPSVQVVGECQNGSRHVFAVVLA